MYVSLVYLIRFLYSFFFSLLKFEAQVDKFGVISDVFVSFTSILGLCFVIVVCILKLVIVFVRGFLFSSYFLFEVRLLKVQLQLSV